MNLLDIIEEAMSGRGTPEDVEAAVRQYLGSTLHESFIDGAVREAEYQRTVWNDGNKGPAEWYWTLGYLASKVIHRDEPTDKRLHHVTAAAGLLANWHAFLIEHPDEQGHTRDDSAVLADEAKRVGEV